MIPIPDPETLIPEHTVRVASGSETANHPAGQLRLALDLSHLQLLCIIFLLVLSRNGQKGLGVK